MTRHAFALRSALALVLSGLLALAPGAARGQSGMRSVKAVSTGGGTSGFDTGPAALYSNPANLTVGPDAPSLEIQLFRLGAYHGGDFYQFEHIDPLFYDNEKALSSDEQKAILDDWFGRDQQTASTYLEVVPLSITHRPSDASWAVGFGIRGRTFQTSAVNKGIFDVLLRGTGEDRTVPVDGRSRAYAAVDVTGAFSYRFSSAPLSVGVSPRVIFGTAFADAALTSQATVSGDSLVHRFDYTARAAGPLSTGLFDTFNAFNDDPVDEVVGGSSGIAGIGGGLDLGATYTVRPGLLVSASITDLGRITWTQEAQTVTPSKDIFRFEGVSLDSDRIDDEYDGATGEYIEDQVDSLAHDAYEDVNRDRSSFATGLPTTLHLNGTWDAGFVTLNGGTSIGLNENAGAVPRPAALHVGGTLHLGAFPLRAGARFFGTQAVALSGGFGLDLGFYRFDLGASITPSTSTLGSGARYAVSLSLATIRF
ncbi:DUF5723 family protein [Salinibacter altiplanensis]|uniref:DUF5723 family protein n=1 Tax=Salinibacter altiplanensis TaxID=1803181 RepID=UPI000C9FD50D|nr:DUF5723 family protein [Salinibacter altiplanensis]